MRAAFTFTQRADAHAELHTSTADAILLCGRLVHVDASKSDERAALGLAYDVCNGTMRFTAEQPRAAAAELLACANACDAAMGRA